jgi:vitamin B12 transporter
MIKNLLGAAGSKQGLLLWLVAGILFTLHFSNAHAVEADRTVVVTASVGEGDEVATASRVTVLDREYIESNQFRSVADLIRQVPGVAVAQNGTPGQTIGLFIRGAKTSNNTLKINGRRLPYNLAGSFNLEDFSLDNVERIEVARGPLSAVHGGTAIGGVINIVTRTGQDVDKVGGSVRFEGGSYHTFSEAVALRGAQGPLDFSIEASRFDSKFQRDNNETRKTTLSANVGYDISDQVRFDVQGLYLINDVGAPNNTTINNASANVYRELWMISPGLHLEPFEWWHHNFIFTHSESRQIATEFPPAVNFFAPPPTLNFGQNNNIQVDTDEFSTTGTWWPSEIWEISAGFNLTGERYFRIIDIENEFAFPVTPAGTRDIFDTRTNLGTYLEMKLEPVTGWHWIGNVRYDHYSDFEDPVTWRIGQSYQIPTLDTIVHANYGTAFAPPTPQDQAAVFFGNSNLQPEYSCGWEVGLTQSLFGGRAEIQATYFHNEVEDLILLDAFFVPQNVGQALLEGVETSLFIQWTETLSSQFAYTYLTAENQTNGQRLVRRPRHAMQGDMRWIPVDWLTLSSAFSYLMEREDGFATSVQGPFNLVDLEDYFLMRLAITAQVNEHLKVFGRIENVTNDQYSEVAGFPALDQALYGGLEVIF